MGGSRAAVRATPRPPGGLPERRRIGGVIAPSASYSFIVRMQIASRPGMLGRVASAIGDAGGDIGAVDLVEPPRERTERDITVKARASLHAQQIVNRLRRVAGVRIGAISDRTFLMHLGGKIEIRNKVPIRTRDDLSMAYTPGVARVCLAIRDDRQRAFSLTIKHNMVAVVTDGTAVLGLGDIGPEAALPVMEGKAMLFKEFAGVDAFPICLGTKDVDKIVETVKLVAPGFGGVNLEDIAAPRCFEIEARLRKELDIPVFHDDQHGTAVVFIGLSVPGILTARGLKRMARDPIVFAMANPEPEIRPEEAAKHVRVMATGRSDYPNQINNVLCFPGFFRGLLDARARAVNDEMKLAAARALAACVSRNELGEEYIIPSVFNRGVAPAVAEGVARDAQETAAARRGRRLDLSGIRGRLLAGRSSSRRSTKLD